MASTLDWMLLIGFLFSSLTLAGTFWMSRRTHRLIAKSAGAKHNSTRVYWMSEKTMRDGSTRWVSVSGGIKIEVPPSDAIDFLPNGKKLAVGFLLTKDQVVWLRDDKLQGDISKKALRDWQPFTAVQRAALVNEYDKAIEERSQKKSMSELIFNLGPMVLLSMVVMLIVLFGADLLHPLMEFQQNQNVIAEKQAQMIDRVSALIDRTGTLSSIPQQATASEGNGVLINPAGAPST